MLSDYYIKVKSWISDNKPDLYIAAIIFLVGLASFGLGRLSILWPEKEPIRIMTPGTLNTTYEQKNGMEPSSASGLVKGLTVQQGKYVASKSGTAYHYPWCPSALKIKEENKIWFNTKEEAQKAGYKPAGNCEGL